MSIDMFSENEALAAIEAKLENHQWWVFVGNTELCRRIEEAHYTGENAGDFEILMLPYEEIRTIGFAKKRVMGAAQLAEILIAMGSEMTLEECVNNLGEQDILFVGENPEIAMRAFQVLMSPGFSSA